VPRREGTRGTRQKASKLEEEDEMKNLQKAGGVCAVIAALMYVFAMGLVVSRLKPMADASLGFQEYMAFLIANKTLVFIWHLSMYLINGACLVVVALAIHERLDNGAPRLAKIASAFGFIWIALVLLSGLIVNFGNEALITLHGKNQGQAESLKNALDTITLGIDSSDKLLGGLWIGLASLAAFRCKAFPRVFSIFGMVIGAVGLVGTMVPALTSISYLFGIGAIVWWLAIGITMLRKQDIVFSSAGLLARA
jgi:hypothetical protein